MPRSANDQKKIIETRALILVFAVSVGTIVNFFLRQVDSIRKVAAELIDRMADQKTREKYLILEAKFSAT